METLTLVKSVWDWDEATARSHQYLAVGSSWPGEETVKVLLFSQCSSLFLHTTGRNACCCDLASCRWTVSPKFSTGYGHGAFTVFSLCWSLKTEYLLLHGKKSNYLPYVGPVNSLLRTNTVLLYFFVYVPGKCYQVSGQSMVRVPTFSFAQDY
jgi:hypothetical protein